LVSEAPLQLVVVDAPAEVPSVYEVVHVGAVSKAPGPSEFLNPEYVGEIVGTESP
jgi:hypothetical protein